MSAFYETSYANIHRGVYDLGGARDRGYEGAREKAARVHQRATSTREVVFTRNVTEALNLVAYAWGLDNLGPGDIVARDRAGAPLELRALAVHRPAAPAPSSRVIPVDDQGELAARRARRDRGARPA